MCSEWHQDKSPVVMHVLDEYMNRDGSHFRLRAQTSTAQDFVIR